MPTLDPKTLHMAQVAFAILLVLSLAIVGVWDVYALYAGERWATVSSLLKDWSVKWPVLPLVVGIILGHVFWA